MGFLRLILAISVVATHAGSILSWDGVGNVLAVQSFYIVSGFYMALVLSSKYSGNSSYGLFITNRALRLYPIYWVVLLASFALHGGVKFVESFSFFDLSGKILIWFSNIFLLGQDLFLFTGVNPNGSIFFTENFQNTDPRMSDYLLVPQGWSLSLEICFYLMAPFIVRLKSRTILGIAFVSLLLRIVLIQYGLNRDPWKYRFFPNEIFFFLIGIWVFRFYNFWKKNEVSFLLKAFVGGAILTYSILFQYIMLPFFIKALGFYAVLIFGLSFLFDLTKSSKIDRFFGELSYPIYISHLLVKSYLATRDSVDPAMKGLIVSIGSILLSVLLLYGIGNPIEKIRAKIAKVASSEDRSVGFMPLLLKLKKAVFRG